MTNTKYSTMVFKYYLNIQISGTI